MTPKEKLQAEKQATFKKYQKMGLRQYSGITASNPTDANQDNLRAAYNAEIAAIEKRYKIMVGQA